MEMNVFIEKVADGLVIIDSRGIVLARASSLPGEYSIELHAYAESKGWKVVPPVPFGD